MKIKAVTIGILLVGVGFILIGRATKYAGPQIIGVGFILIGISTIL